MKRTVLLFLLLSFAVLIVGCGPGSNPPAELKEISGITFADKTVTYDGQTHSLEISGTLPEGVNLEYLNNEQIDVGEHKVTAKMSGEGYKPLQLEAKLIIKGMKITGVTFADKTVMYDGNVHELSVSGTLPEGVAVSYQSDVSGVTNSTSEVGEYNITATLSGKGYETITLKAKLTISQTGQLVFSGITFSNKTVIYDGSEHEITIDGTLPEGTSVVYSSTTEGVTNKATNVGSYHVTVVISKENYETLTLQAVLKITEEELKEFTGITFNNKTAYYDTTEHEIVITGTTPEGTLVEYSSVDTPNGNNKAIETGKYEVKATLSKLGYRTLVLVANLTIKPQDKEWFITSFDNAIYFNNGLHNDYLYKHQNNELTRVNYDYAKYFTNVTNKLYYVSQGLLSSSIKSFDGTSSQTILSVNAEYLISEGDILYYVVNRLTNEKSGIYKLDLTAEEPVPVQLFEGKAKYLTLVGNDLYFANGKEDYKLYKISKLISSSTGTLVLDEKIKELIHHSNSLYFTVNKLAGDYLSKLDLLTGNVIKLTSDNAKFLTVAGNYIYYSNHDMINTQIFGKGLYRVSRLKTEDSNLPGEKLYDTEYNVSSLYALNDSTILFYNVYNSHVLKFNVNDKTYVDLMEGFTPPEDTSTQLNSKFESFVWNDRIYYINNSIDGALFYYDTKTNKNIRVTSETVKSFSIINGILYYNAVTWLVNNDLYMVNLREGGLPQMISKNDARDVVIHNDNLYYVKGNATGIGTAIVRLSLSDLSIEEEVYEYNSHHLTIHNNKLYFIKGAGVDEIWSADIAADGKLENMARLGTKKTDWFVIAGDKMYYREVELFYKYLSHIKLDGTEDTRLISSIDPISFILKDGYIYYTNETTSPAKKNGVYKVKIDGTEEVLLYESKDGDGLAIEMHIAGDYLYYYSKTTKRFYRLNLTTKVIEPIDRK